MVKKYFRGVFLVCIGFFMLFLQEIPCKAGSDEVTENDGQIYVVAQDGSGDFETIQQGVDGVESGATLLIRPGTYNESVNIVGKTVNLIGEDRNTCVIQYPGDSYSNPPLNVAAGKVYNLTIHATAKKMDNQEIPAYAIHTDQTYCQDKELHIKNCNIVSATSACIGIGIWGNENIVIEQSDLIASGGASNNIFIHDAPIEEYGGTAYFTLKDCTLENYTPTNGKMAVWSLISENQTNFTFQNVRCVETEEGSKISIENKDKQEPNGWLGLNNVYLTDDCYGNTLEEMNGQ